MFIKFRLTQLTHMRTPFRKRLLLVIGGLLVLCAGLILLTWLQGPRIRMARIDTSKVALASNQRLQLQLNQPAGSVGKKQITVTPAASFTVASGGNTVIVQFSQPLLHDTSYRVQLQLGSHSLDYDFKTAPADIFYAVNTSNEGKIFRRPLAGGQPTAVYDGDLVKDFLIVGNTLVVDSQKTSDAADNQLTLQSLTKGAASQTNVTLPQKGTVMNLQAAPNDSSFGFRFTASDFSSNISGYLGIYDLANDKLTWVEGLNNQPIQTQQWKFAKDSASFLVQGYDNSVFILRPKQAPLPIGQYLDVLGFSADNTEVLVRDMTGTIQILNLKTMQVTPLSGVDSGYVTDAVALSTQQGYIAQTEFTNKDKFGEHLTLTTPAAKKQMYTLADISQGYITHLSLSSNDQYTVAGKITGSENSFAFDIIDTSTGKKITTQNAFLIRWQQ